MRTDTAHAGPWAQLSSPDEAPRPMHPVVPWLAAIIPLLVQFRRLGWELRWVVALVVCSAVLVAVLRLLPRWWLAATLLCTLQFGLSTSSTVGNHAAWVIGVVLMWSVALGAFPVDEQPRFVPAMPRAKIMLVPLGATSLLLVAREGMAAPAVTAGGAALVWLVDLVAGEQLGARLDTAGERIDAWADAGAGWVDKLAAAVARVITAVLMVPISAVMLLTWAAHRLVGYSVLSPPTTRSSRWVRRRSADTVPDQLGARVAVIDPRGGRRTAHRWSAAAVVVATWLLIAAAVMPSDLRTRIVDRLPLPAADAPSVAGSDVAAAPTDDASTGQGPACPVSCAVFEDTADWQQIFDDTSEHIAHARFDAATAYRFEDSTTEYVNVVDGVRRTWSAPPCSCERVTVWWFGGSTAFGFWQRDEYSLPSYVAREAAERGLVLDITNFAVPGWVAGQGVRAFAQAVASTPPDELPDVVMFLDGANDIGAQQTRNDAGRGSDESEPTAIEDQLDELTRTGMFSWSDPTPRPATGAPPLDTPALMTHVVNRYERNVHLGSLLARSIGAVPVFMWQPTASFSPPSASGQPALDGRQDWKESMDAAIPLLPDDVVDLSSSMEDVTEPVWGDPLHTNERGAQLMAAAILDATAGLVAPAGPAPNSG